MVARVAHNHEVPGSSPGSANAVLGIDGRSVVWESWSPMPSKSATGARTFTGIEPEKRPRGESCNHVALPDRGRHGFDMAMEVVTASKGCRGPSNLRQT